MYIVLDLVGTKIIDQVIGVIEMIILVNPLKKRINLALLYFSHKKLISLRIKKESVLNFVQSPSLVFY